MSDCFFRWDPPDKRNTLACQTHKDHKLYASADPEGIPSLVWSLVMQGKMDPEDAE